MDKIKQLEQEIKDWDGLNIHLVKQKKRELRELKKAGVKPFETKAKPKAKPKDEEKETVLDKVRDLLDDGKLNKSYKKKKKVK